MAVSSMIGSANAGHLCRCSGHVQSHALSQTAVSRNCKGGVSGSIQADLNRIGVSRSSPVQSDRSNGFTWRTSMGWQTRLVGIVQPSPSASCRGLITPKAILSESNPISADPAVEGQIGELAETVMQEFERSDLTSGELLNRAQAVGPIEFAAQVAATASAADEAVRNLRRERMLRRQSERSTYLIAAIVSSIGFTSLAGGAVVYRFISQMQAGGEIPYLEMFGTFALAIGAAVGMEFWARWAHRSLWHASLWDMHESHHRPREGPFELNDIFAIINAGPAILLLAYGFFTKGLFPGLCFGAGLGITLFGMAYMFVHDGLVHRRFPVGPIADVPYLQKVAAAHQLHHADKFEGVPYGLFFGPQELEAVGGQKDLEELLEARRKAVRQSKVEDN